MTTHEAVDGRAFRDVMGRFATGVTVITGLAPGGEPVGVTVNSFTSVSLEPPLVLFCLDRQANCLDAFSAGGGFAVNLLSSEQLPLSQSFASQDADKWVGVGWRPGDGGRPLLDRALGHLQCRTHAIHDGGDHMIFIGRVVDVALGEVGRPLLYFAGDYARLHGSVALE